MTAVSEGVCDTGIDADNKRNAVERQSESGRLGGEVEEEEEEENVASDPLLISGGERPEGPAVGGSRSSRTLIGQESTPSKHYHQEQAAADDKEDMSGSYTPDGREEERGLGEKRSTGLASNHSNKDASVVYEGEGNVREAGHLGSEDDHVEKAGEGAVVGNGHRAGRQQTLTGDVNEEHSDEQASDAAGAKSVINVEIRSKSVASIARVGETANKPQAGNDTPPAATNQGSGVLPLDTPGEEPIGIGGDPVADRSNKLANNSLPHAEPRKENSKTTLVPTLKRKKMKKSIFISYSPEAGFVERKFIVDCVRQFKENNLAEDIWFDKDEKAIETPCWFSQRVEAVERCRAAVVFMSERYFASSCSFYEAKTLLERYTQDSNAVRIFTVVYAEEESFVIPHPFMQLANKCVDLGSKIHFKKSLAEKSSLVVGAFMMELEKVASVNAPPVPVTPPDTEFTGEYKKKRLCHWGANDLQEWLFKLGVKEFYRQSLAENMVDGFLLTSMAEQDMVTYLAIDSRVVRRKLTQQVLATLEKEHKQADNWHIRARALRPRPNVLYLVYDPTDIRIGQNLKHDLSKKGLQVFHHTKLGTSKEEFLQHNGPIMAQATHVLVILTDAASNSPFVFHELVFAEWLKRRVVIAQFKTVWNTLRPALRAVIGDSPAVDFETKMYTESMAILEHHIKPFRSIPGIVLEQGYLNKMSEGIKPLFALAHQTKSKGDLSDTNSVESINPRVFISYQWDMSSKVEEIRRVLEPHGLLCWADISASMSGGPRGNSGLSSRGTGGNNGLNQLGFHLGDLSPESLTTQIQRNMKAAGVVLCCITPKYMQSDNCIKDLSLAENLHKPIIPVMLRFCPWPPEAVPPPIRKILVKHVPVDLSNDKLYKQNISVLLERIKKCTGLKQ